MAAANLAELPAWALDLLERSPLAHLSYLDDGARPRVLPVTFAIVAEDLWTAIDQKPKRNPADEIARVRYLRRRPQAALCADHYEDDWSRLWWVRASGCGAILEAAEERRRALAVLSAKYPQYRDEPPEGAVLALEIAEWRGWSAS